MRIIELDGEEWLWYKTFPINIAIIRVTSADENGNLTIEKETTKMDQLALAQAAKNNGGIVIAEVERVIKAGEMNPREVYVRYYGGLCCCSITGDALAGFWQ